jgi:DNA-directed RNA polymerase specialized sigma24 family protein
MRTDKWKKMHRTVQQGKTPDQVDHSQEGASEEQSRQKFTLLAANMGMSVENIADCQLEEGQVGSTKLGVEEYVVSEIIVETFINSLPEELRKLTRLLTFEEYQLNELTGILKLSLGVLRRRKKQIREALRRFQEEQIQGRSTNGR